MENPSQLLMLQDLFTIYQFPVIFKNVYFKLPSLVSNNRFCYTFNK